jgi:hypothetical protein
MIKIDVLLGIGSMKADWGRGMIKGHDKEFPFLSLKKDNIDIKIIMASKEAITKFREVLDQMEKSINEHKM